MSESFHINIYSAYGYIVVNIFLDVCNNYNNKLYISMFFTMLIDYLQSCFLFNGVISVITVIADNLSRVTTTDIY